MTILLGLLATALGALFLVLAPLYPLFPLLLSWALLAWAIGYVGVVCRCVRSVQDRPRNHR